jgi:predicted RNase H-like nuclease (RuvC/YqgF family)
MNLEAIPKSFWNAASIALLAFTIGFLFISYKYGDLTVKFSELEIRATNASALESSLTAQEQSLKEQEKIITARENQIEDLTTLLDEKVKELGEVKKELAALQADANSEDAHSILKKVAEKLSKDHDFAQQIETKKSTLDALKLQQLRQEDRYAQQRDIYSIQQQQQMKWLE